MQQNPQQTQISADDVKSEMIERKIEVNDDGSVIIHETHLDIVKLSSRNFVSWMRSFEQNRDNIKRSLSDEVRKLTEEKLQETEDDIKKLLPFIAESEKKTKDNYEKLKREGMIKKIAEELNKNISDINLDYMNKVWSNLIANEEEVVNALTSEQKQKFLKIKIRFMEKNRGVKKH